MSGDFQSVRHGAAVQLCFFYGLFMDEGLLRGMGLAPRNTRIARLEGFGLRIGQRATLVAQPGERAYGTVMDISPGSLAALYSGEGLADYRPEAVRVITRAGETLDAITYILPTDKLSGRNSDYAAKLAAVAVKLGLPDTYIREIESWKRS